MERSGGGQYHDSLMFQTSSTLSVPKEENHEDDLYSTRPRHNEAYGGRLSSLVAFVFCVFIYISIFYLFNISPSSLLNDSKFWFFISNTLIFIIAADYGSFSSYSKRKNKQLLGDLSYHDEEHVDKSKTSTGWEIMVAYTHDSSSSCIVRQYHGLYDTCSGGRPKSSSGPEFEVDKLETVNKMQKVPGYRITDPDRNHNLAAISSWEDQSGEKRPNNNGSPPLVNDHQWEIIVNEEGGDDEDNIFNYNIDRDEYSAMSDEELNKRVEELKRQIRLQ